MGSLEGKVAFITGAARGQGRAHAVRLAEDGADIIAVDVCAPVRHSAVETATSDDMATTVDVVEGLGRAIVAHRVDVRSLDGLRTAVDDGVARFGRLDIVIANAGITAGGWSSYEMPEDAWDAVVDVNLGGAWRTCVASIPHVVAGGRGGSIVLTSSIAGLRGLPGSAAYTSAKHGEVGLCKVLALELAQHDIRVNTIHPHGVNTEMVRSRDSQAPMPAGIDPRVLQVFAPLLPVRGMAEPEDIAAIVSWLVSDAARFLTGCQIPIDFGNSLM
jgi:SDR family mycofactocin-dependent oxidoreductase